MALFLALAACSTEPEAPESPPEPVDTRAAAQERAGEDLGALAQFEAVEVSRTGGGVVLCDALPGQGDGAVAVHLEGEEPAARWVRGLVRGGRVMVSVPTGSGSGRLRYQSGLEQPVSWEELETGQVVECAR